MTPNLISDAPDARDVPSLIAYILERFHETHRRELPDLVALAQALHGPGAEVAEQLESMGQALEMHMFKEEVRLFPMMEQGGNSLIGHLIDDMSREHRAHDEQIELLGSLVATLQSPPSGEATLAALRVGVARLIDDLHLHMRIEDDVLFPPFASAPRPRASLA